MTTPGAETLETFLHDLAGEGAAPGGGAAAAVTAALAAALLAMVCRVTVRRDPDAPAVLAEIAGEADRLRRAALDLATDDASAYTAVLEARRRPAPERDGAVARALREATDVPLRTARLARDVVARGARVAPFARSSTLSDLGVGGALAWGSFEGAALTARTNLADTRDAAYATAVRAELARLADEAASIRQRLAETLAARASATMQQGRRP